MTSDHRSSRSPLVAIAAFLLAPALSGCGTTTPRCTPSCACPDGAASGSVCPSDGAGGPDTADTALQDAIAIDDAPDALSTGTEPRGCTPGEPCGGGTMLVCDDRDVAVGFATPICTAPCTDSTDAGFEASECAGARSTCLTRGDADPSGRASTASFCTSACRPSPLGGADTGCEHDSVCTGWWYTHPSEQPDAPGCQPFCHSDVECATGLHCNTYVGTCGAAPIDATRALDGANCDPRHDGAMGRPPSDCRSGMCFQVVASDATRGICGALVDTHVTQTCPDDPGMRVRIVGPGASRDDLGLCIWKSCSCDADCDAPQVCVQQIGGGGLCTIADPAASPPEHGTPSCAASDGGTG